MLTPFVWLALSLPALGKSQATVTALIEFAQSLNLYVILSTPASIIGMTI
jgi:hypothetical protein